LQLCVPLKVPVAQQSVSGDAHVYGARSRFMSEKVLKTMEPVSIQSSLLGLSATPGGTPGQVQGASLDASARLKAMW
jgi:hypothetical protein